MSRPWDYLIEADNSYRGLSRAYVAHPTQQGLKNLLRICMRLGKTVTLPTKNEDEKWPICPTTGCKHDDSRNQCMKNECFIYTNVTGGHCDPSNRTTSYSHATCPGGPMLRASTNKGQGALSQWLCMCPCHY